MPSTHQKALEINLEKSWYGTFAEIGAGQETARWFFRVGGAAGTVAEAISAYDKAVSDLRYGATPRFVTRKRLRAMLAQEWDKLVEKLGPQRGDHTSFFVFANTVAQRSWSRHDDGHGWVGVRFQTAPGAEPSDVIIHAFCRDGETVREQEALGVLGVNLLWAALRHHAEPARIIQELLDDLSRDRIEVDVIDFRGPAFAGVDNRLMALQLVEQERTDAALFTAAGEVVQPADVLYKRPVVVERGQFRPITRLTHDILHRGVEALKALPDVAGEEPLVVLEMTLRDLTVAEQIDHEDFLSRADALGALGHHVLISRFAPYYALSQYLAHYTNRPIGLAMGIPTLEQLADARFYQDLRGGLIESAGRLFTNQVRAFVYPRRDAGSGRVTGLADFALTGPAQHLLAYLVETGQLVATAPSDPALLDIDQDAVCQLIGTRDARWEAQVPAAAAAVIRDRGLFCKRACPPGVVSVP
ncbi:MAG: TonB-dependent receptor [bacterium]|nr:TonB-dependent receptor [bacterium]